MGPGASAKSILKGRSTIVRNLVNLNKKITSVCPYRNGKQDGAKVHFAFWCRAALRVGVAHGGLWRWTPRRAAKVRRRRKGVVIFNGDCGRGNLPTPTSVPLSGECCGYHRRRRSSAINIARLTESRVRPQQGSKMGSAPRAATSFVKGQFLSIGRLRFWGVQVLCTLFLRNRAAQVRELVMIGNRKKGGSALIRRSRPAAQDNWRSRKWCLAVDGRVDYSTR